MSTYPPHGEPFVETRSPSAVTKIPDGATRMIFEDLVEVVTDRETLYTQPVNKTVYEVWWNKNEFDDYMRGKSYSTKPAVHPSLEGKVWLVGGVTTDRSIP